MRISIDATGLSGVKTGTAVYLTEILKCWNQNLQLNHEFIIFASAKSLSYFYEIGLDRRFQLITAPNSRLIRSLWQQLILPQKIRLSQVDVHWGTGFVLPLLSHAKMAVTIHDLTFQKFPSSHEFLKRIYFPFIILHSVKKAKKVIAVSFTTEHDLHQLIPNSIHKTETTLLAPRSFKSESNQNSKAATFDFPYLLSVGTLEPRKNIERLLKAWLDIPAAERGATKLILVGMKGWMIDKILSEYHGTHESLLFPGYLDDAALGELMESAIALLYPSLYEGFGLPVIEAMAKGIPVLTSDTGATREIAGNAALLVNPYDLNEIKQGILKLLRHKTLRDQLSIHGRTHVEKFSWNKTADQTIRILEQLANHKLS